MKIIAFGVFVGFASALKWDQTIVPVSARGYYNEEENYWSRGLTECNDQCIEGGNQVCGENQIKCCVEGKC